MNAFRSAPVRQRDPHVRGPWRGRADGVVPDPELDDAVEVEELVTTRLGPVFTRRQRAIGLVIAGAAAVVGFGFAGGLTPPKRATADEPARVHTSVGPSAIPSAAVELIAPRADTVSGPVVMVRLAATKVVGPVRLTVTVDDLVVGEASVVVGAAGTFDAAVPVFSAPIDATAEIVVAPVSGPLVGSVLRGQFVLVGVDRAAIWGARAIVQRNAPTLVVTGFASMSLGQLSVLAGPACDGSGQGVETRPRLDPGLPGALGGRILGMAPFRVAVPRASAWNGTIELDWRDSATGTWGAVCSPVPRSAEPSADVGTPDRSAPGSFRTG